MTFATLMFVLGVVTNQHGTTIPAHTKIACQLATTISTATAQPGDTFTITCNDPSYPVLNGAKITGHLTDVSGPRGLLRASISFLFDSIVFVNGLKEQFRGYVINPQVTQNNSTTPPPASYSQVPNSPSSSTVFWSTKLGPKTKETAQTGGTATAAKGGVQATAKAGTPVTLQLASDLTTP
jgi:hypothetical protein